MTDNNQVEQPASAVAPNEKGKATKKKAAPAVKAKKVADHPKYSEMIKEALGVLKERGGSSRQALLKYIMNNYKLGNDEKGINAHLKIALRAGVKNKTLKQSKGVGASGSFKLGNDKDVKEVKPKLKTVEKAPRAKAVPVKPEPPAAKKAKPAAEVAKKPAKPVKKAKAEAEAKTKKPKPGAAKKTKSPAKTKIAVQPPKAKSPKKEVKKASPKPKKVKASANPKTTKKAKSPAKAKRVTKASAKK